MKWLIGLCVVAVNSGAMMDELWGLSLTLKSSSTMAHLPPMRVEGTTETRESPPVVPVTSESSDSESDDERKDPPVSSGRSVIGLGSPSSPQTTQRHSFPAKIIVNGFERPGSARVRSSLSQSASDASAAAQVIPPQPNALSLKVGNRTLPRSQEKDQVD